MSGGDATRRRFEMMARAAALDPGGARLRSAVAATASMGAAMAVIYGYCLLLHPQIGTFRPLIMGSIAAMQVSAALMQPRRRQRVKVALWQPVMVGSGLVLNVLAREFGPSGSELWVFAAVAFAAVVIRRHGAEFVVLGLVGWAGYFTAQFAKPTLSDVPFLLSVQVLSGACALILSLTLWRHRPRRALRHALRSWSARSLGVIRAASRCLDRPAGARRRRLLLRRQAQQHGASLVVEGWLGHAHADADTAGHDDAWADGARPGGLDHGGVRRRMLEAQYALDSLVAAVTDVADVAAEQGGEPDEVARGLLTPLRRGDADTAAGQARRLLAGEAGRPGPSALGSGSSASVLGLAAAVEAVADLDPFDAAAEAVAAAGDEDFAAAVVLAPGGALTGAAGIAATVVPRGPRFLRGMSLPLRQAIQVGVATLIAVALGRLVSPTQVTWAVLAVFIVFLGPGTRGETAVKALHRVLGTLAGIIVAVPVAFLVGGNPVVVALLALVACAIGHYLAPRSYAYMMFCITVVVLQIYDMMHEFSLELLGLRLAETSLGAVIALAVASLLLPVGTRETAARASARFFEAAAAVLDAVADRFGPERAHTRDENPDPDVATEPRPGAASLHLLIRQADEHGRRVNVAAGPLLMAPGRWASRHRTALSDHAACGAALRWLAVRAQGLDGPLDPAAAVRVRHLAEAARRATVARTTGSGTPAPARSSVTEPASAAAGVPPGGVSDDVVSRHLEALGEAMRRLGVS